MTSNLVIRSSLLLLIAAAVVVGITIAVSVRAEERDYLPFRRGRYSRCCTRLLGSPIHAGKESR